MSAGRCRRGPAGGVRGPDRAYSITVIDIWASEQSFAAFGQTLGPAIYQGSIYRVPVPRIPVSAAKQPRIGGQP